MILISPHAVPSTNRMLPAHHKTMTQHSERDGTIDTRSGSHTGKESFELSTNALHCKRSSVIVHQTIIYSSINLSNYGLNTNKRFEHMTHQVWGRSGWWGVWFRWGSAGRWQSAWQWSAPPSPTSACFASGRSPGRCLRRTLELYRSWESRGRRVYSKSWKDWRLGGEMSLSPPAWRSGVRVRTFCYRERMT